MISKMSLMPVFSTRVWIGVLCITASSNAILMSLFLNTYIFSQGTWLYTLHCVCVTKDTSYSIVEIDEY